MKLLRRLLFILPALVAIPAGRAATIGTQEPAAYSSRIDNPGNDWIFDSATDAAGNVYVVGRTSSATTGEPVDMSIEVYRDRENDTTGRPALSSQTSIVSDSGSGYIIKYDRDGNVVWKRSAGGPPFTTGITGVVLDPAGNIYVAGFFQGTATFGNLTLTAGVRSNVNFANTLPSFNAQTNSFVAMLDADGVWQWVRQFEFAVFTSTKTTTTNLGTDAVSGGVVQVATQSFPNLVSPVADNQGRGLVRDSEGNLYIKMFLHTPPSGATGAFGADRVTWLRTAGSGIVAGSTTDATGAFQYSYNGTAFMTKLAATPPAPGSPAGTQPTYDWRWIRPVTSGVLYDSAGTITTISTAPQPSRIYSLAVDNNDSVYFTGDWGGNAVATGITTPRTPFTTNDGYVARWRTSDGTSLYFASYSGATAGTGSSKGGALVIDTNRNIYVTGNVTNAAQLRLRSNDNTTTTSAIAAGSASSTSFFVGMLNPSGQWMWSETPTLFGGTSPKITATTLSRDSAGTLWMGGAWSSGALWSFLPAAPGSASAIGGITVSGSFEAFIHRLTIDSAGNRAWGAPVQTTSVAPGGGPSFWETGTVLAGGGGVTYWGLQQHALTTTRFVTNRSPDAADQAFDTVSLRGAMLLAVPAEGSEVLSSKFSVLNTVLSGAEVVPPAGVYRDANGKTLQPEITLPNAGNASGAANFYWDDFGKKLYALDPQVADIKWKVSADQLNQQRITRRVQTVWPTAAQGLITHVTGAGSAGDEPKVALELPDISFNHTFSTILYTSNQATVSGAKLFSAKSSGYSILLYTAGKNTAVGSAAVSLEVVRSVLWTDATVNTADTAAIGFAIDGSVYNHADPSGKNGYIINARARFDGTGAGAAFDRTTQLGTIFPVNRDEPGPDDDMVIIWSNLNPRGIAWPTKVVTYNCIWPQSPQIVIASRLGSETPGPLGVEPLDPARFQGMTIYHQPNKNLPGYNPNEEHALLAPSNGVSAFQAVFALRNDLNDIGGRTTSQPFTLLRYQDATDGLKTKFKVYQVVAERSNVAGFSDYLFSSYTGIAGTRVQAPYPLPVLGDAAGTTGGGSAYFKDRKNQVWAKSAGIVTARFFYPLLENFWFDTNGDGFEDSAAEAAWLDRLPGGTPNTPKAIEYTISWPPTAPTLAVGDTLTNARDNLPNIEGMVSATIIFDESAPNLANPISGGARILDYATERKFPL